MTDTWILTPSSSPLHSSYMAIFNHHSIIIMLIIDPSSCLQIILIVIILIMSRTRGRGRSIWHVTLSYPPDDCYACAAATMGCQCFGLSVSLVLVTLQKLNWPRQGIYSMLLRCCFAAAKKVLTGPPPPLLPLILPHPPPPFLSPVRPLCDTESKSTTCKCTLHTCRLSQLAAAWQRCCEEMGRC